MAAKKTDKGSNLVAVDITELGRGLKTAFTGIAMVFGSLGCAEAGEEVIAALPGVKMPRAADGGKADDETADAPDAPDAADVTDGVAEGSAEETAEGSAEAAAADETQPGEDDLPWDGAAKAPTQASAAVTADDITRVIVAKIKQKRSNNARIGALLKAYGVEKVSSLPAEKYEAFLTDISQL